MTLIPPDDTRPSVRASDAERDQTILVLRDHCAEGRLTLEEFAERLDIVLVAKTRAELDVVTRDLPVAPLDRPRPRHAPTIRVVKPQGRKRFAGILSSTKQRRRWHVPSEADAIAILGDCELDLRDATYDGGELRLTALAILGEVKIVVPEGMDVQVSGFSALGENKIRVADAEPLPGMPTLHVQAYSVLGTVSVHSRPRGEARALPNG